MLGGLLLITAAILLHPIVVRGVSMLSPTWRYLTMGLVSLYAVIALGVVLYGVNMFQDARAMLNAPTAPPFEGGLDGDGEFNPEGDPGFFAPAPSADE
jgi:uncharacterized membrane protein